MNTAKTEIADEVRRGNASQQSSVGSDAVHTIACAAPDIADFIHTNAIGIAIIYTIKIASTCELATTSLHIKNMNHAIRSRIFRGTCIDDIKHRFIR